MNDKGSFGENYAGKYLESVNFLIIEKNYKSRYGEIDIIAKDCKYLLFVEVKERNENSVSLPREAVNIKKQRKIIKTALKYLSEREVDLQPRFDVIEVFKAKNKTTLNHIKNAFTMEAYNESY